jgi:hypothetical protein
VSIVAGLLRKTKKTLKRSAGLKLDCVTTLGVIDRLLQIFACLHDVRPPGSGGIGQGSL